MEYGKVSIILDTQGRGYIEDILDLWCAGVRLRGQSEVAKESLQAA